MFFSTPPLIAEMQTYLLMVLGMQAMILPPLILAFERMRLRTEPERDRRGIRDQFRARGKFSRVGSRLTGSLELADAFELPKLRTLKETLGMLCSSAVIGRPKPQGWCDHRTRPMTVVFTEMGCHASCQGCGAIGPGCPTSEEAQRALLLVTGKSGSDRYL